MKKYVNGQYIEMTQEEIEEYNKNNIEIQQEPTLEEQIKELQEVNHQQDELINISLLATDEMYMMIEPLLVNTLSTQSNNKMVDMYVAMVQRQLKDIEEIPSRYKEQVKEILGL